MSSLEVMCVAGTRPNFVKVAPILPALRDRGMKTTLVHTGQHYDAALSDVFLSELGIGCPDYDLEAGSGSHAAQTAAIMTAFEPLLDELRPDVVLVVGDVNSTLACALVAAKAGVLLAHVEAGLRSRDWAMPEEINRVVVDRVSDCLLAPSEDAAVNLRSEGCDDERIHVVGNVMIDTLLAHLDRARERPVLGTLGLARGEFGLVTLHRPSNVDDPAVLQGLLDAVGDLGTDVPFVFPAHPRTRACLGLVSVPNTVRVIEPTGYLDTIALLDASRLVLTDSGGIQEEATVLAIPCLTLRDTTERPITVEEGTNRVAGTDPDRIRALGAQVLADGVEPRRPALWDGRASERIAGVVAGLTPRGRR